MKLDKSPQSEISNLESGLARFANGSRALLLLALSSIAGCVTAHVPSPANRRSALIDDAVEEICSKLGRFQLSGGKIPSQLRELDSMCMEKDVLEEQIARLRSNK